MKAIITETEMGDLYKLFSQTGAEIERNLVPIDEESKEFKEELPCSMLQVKLQFPHIALVSPFLAEGRRRVAHLREVLALIKSYLDLKI